MKYLLIITILFSFTVHAQTQTLSHQLEKLRQEHNYVEMDSRNKNSQNSDYYFYKAVYANVCNKPEQSIQYLDNLENNKKEKSFQSFSYWKLKNDNYVKLFDYKAAYETSKVLTTKFEKEFSKEELQDEINSMRMWEVLQNQNPQSIEIFDTISVGTIRDKADLITTRVTANDVNSSFVFDTGAGISCIAQSMANRMGLIILRDNNIEIMSLTGVSSKVHIGVAPNLTIGNLKIHNTPFLIYPDAAFTFANGAYVINGIIGFPIAKDLGTITIEENKLSFSKTASPVDYEKNMFLEQLRPILILSFHGKKLPFNFDSGAKESHCYKPFYELFKPYLDKNGQVITETFAGAGGQEITHSVLEINNVELALNKEKLILKRLKVDRDNYSIYGKTDYGNIGQDLIGNFEKAIISFDHNYLKLEK